MSSEGTGPGKHAGVEISRAREVLAVVNVERVGGEREERSQKVTEKPAASTSVQTAIISRIGFNVG
jgi:hypothetical protein